MDQRIFDMVQQLADKLGVTVEHLLEIYSRQVFFEGILYLAIVTGFFLISAAFFIPSCILLFKKGFDEYDNITDKGTFYSIVAVISGLSFICFLVAIVIGATDWITKIVNPEYGAIHRLTQDLGQFVLGGK